ncbi:MAG: hypothetical protein ABIK09_19255 [Pseudomonadota bacterium]
MPELTVSAGPGADGEGRHEREALVRVGAEIIGEYLPLLADRDNAAEVRGDGLVDGAAFHTPSPLRRDRAIWKALCAAGAGRHVLELSARDLHAPERMLEKIHKQDQP